MSGRRPQLVFTIDVECWGQSVLDRSLPVQAHAADNVRRMLAMLHDAGARATLFVLGKFAERHPAVVRDAAAAGHEIASHGYGHVEVFRLTPDAFRADLRRAGEIIAGITGTRPTGYRAPVFSIGRSNLWALGVLADEGYVYDASIFPFAGPRYGIGDWPVSPCRVALGAERSIVEYPATVARFAGKRVPISGGGYARLMPGGLLRFLLRREARQRAAPPVFYCHPYEIDAREIARCYPHVPRARRWHQGLGRRGFARKLQALLSGFACIPVVEALAGIAELPSVEFQATSSIAPSSPGESAVTPPVGSDRYPAVSVGSGTSMYS